MIQQEQFIIWLNNELDQKGWSRSEAARRGGFSPSMMDKVIGGFSKPGIEFCRGVSRAFSVPLEDVFRLAGILPSAGRPVRERRQIVYEVNGEERVLALWRALSSEDQRIVRELMERLQPEARIIGENE